jgi:hypothetical protein
MGTNPPQSVGLGGDGDEIAAIRDVEEAFGVALDYADAPGWSTAGNVYASRCNALPAEDAQNLDVWERFATALTLGTGVDPKCIEPGSPLLSQSRFWVHVADASAMIWLIVAIALAVGMGLALL